jgi:hypothetical protein
MNEPLKNTPRREVDPSLPPRTRLGERLLRIRERIVASGERLLSWNEVEHELAERRGEAEHSGR